MKSAKALNLTHLLPFGLKSPLDTGVIQPKPASIEWWEATIVWEDSRPPVEKKEDRIYPFIEGEVRNVAPRIQVKQMPGLGALKMYAGRKRMFKGHKWERVQARKKKRTDILMRDMSKRIARYKEVSITPWPADVETQIIPQWYHRRKPNPLRPPRGTKAPKLPF